MTVNAYRQFILNRLKTSDEPLTGEALGLELNISKVAIWKHIKALREAGYDINSSRSGYRLIQEPDIPDGYQIVQSDTVVYHYQNIGSTMDVAAELHNDQTFTFVTSLRQHHGRGLKGREWPSLPGGLYTTLAFKPIVSARYCSAYTLLSAIAVMEILFSLYNLRICFKWPADLFFNDSKVGGILTEIHGELESPSLCMIGLGLYIHQGSNPLGTSALEEQCDKQMSRALIANSYLSSFYRHINESLLKDLSQYIFRNENVLEKGVTIADKSETDLGDFKLYSIVNGEKLSLHLEN